MKYMFETGHRTIPIMKSATAEYYKRVNGYAHFTCTQGLELYDLCNQVVASGQRLEFPIAVTVTAPEEYGDEPVARITQVLSLKNLGASKQREGLRLVLEDIYTTFPDWRASRDWFSPETLLLHVVGDDDYTIDIAEDEIAPTHADTEKSGS